MTTGKQLNGEQLKELRECHIKALDEQALKTDGFSTALLQKVVAIRRIAIDASFNRGICVKFLELLCSIDCDRDQEGLQSVSHKAALNLYKYTKQS